MPRRFVAVLYAFAYVGKAQAEVVSVFFWESICAGNTCPSPSSPSNQIGAQLMVERINQGNFLRGNHILVLEVSDEHCSSEYGLSLAVGVLTLPSSDRPFGVIGCSCSTCTAAAAPILNFGRVPMISARSTSPALSDRTKYPNFFRIEPPDNAAIKAYLRVFQSFKWMSIGHFSSTETQTLFGDFFQEEVHKAGMTYETVSRPAIIMKDDTEASAKAALHELVTVRVRGVVALAYETYVRSVVCQMAQQGIRGRILAYFGWFTSTWLTDALSTHSCSAPQMRQAAEYFLSASELAWNEPNTPVACDNSGATVAEFAAEQARREGSGLPWDMQVSDGADAVCMFAKLFNRLIDDGLNVQSLSQMTEEVYSKAVQAMQLTDFEGVSGRVFFPKNGSSYGAGDRKGPLDIYQRINEARVAIGRFVQSDTDMIIEWAFGKRVLFDEGYTMELPPPEHAPCPVNMGYSPSAKSCVAEAGYFLGNDSMPMPCPAGTWSGWNGNEECVNCSIGTYSGMGATTCSQCAPGQYSDVKGSSACKPCGRGQVPTTANDSCTTCHAGHEPGDDGSECVVCPAGKMSQDGRNCSACPVGTHSDPAVASVSCQPCVAGTSAPEMSTLCYTCPVNTFANSRTATCFDCQMFTMSREGSALCDFDVTFAILVVLGVIVEFAAMLPCGRNIARHLKIADVSTQGGNVVVSTSHPHGIKLYCAASSKVRIFGTGHPALDTPRRVFRVAVLDGRRLALLNDDGSPMTEPVNSSMGILAQCLPDTLMRRGTRWASAGAVSLVLMPIPWALPVIFSEVLLERPEHHTMTLILCCTILAAALAGILYAAQERVRYWSSLPPVRLRLRQYQKVLLKENPHPVSCERGAHRAVSVRQLSNLYDFFADFIQDRNAYYLDPNIIRPLTHDAKLSFAELAGPHQVDFFVSHWWGNAFVGFVNAVQHHAKNQCCVDHGADGGLWRQGRGMEDICYWVCFLSNNQWQIGEELGRGDWRTSSFYLSLRSKTCRATCIVLDAEAMPLTRSWCLFEVVQTYRKAKERGRSDQPGVYYCTSRGVIGAEHAEQDTECFDIAIALAKRLAVLNLQDARASDAHDAEMIRRVVEQEGGFAKMNEFIRENMMMTLNAVKNQFERSLSTLETDLREDTAFEQRVAHIVDDAGQRELEEISRAHL